MIHRNKLLESLIEACEKDSFKELPSWVINVINKQPEEQFDTKYSKLKKDLEITCNLHDDLLKKYESLKENPPLKLEELKEGMWVWDNKEKMYGKIAHEPYQRFGLLTVPGYMWGVFEENRFYRREVNEND